MIRRVHMPDSQAMREFLHALSQPSRRNRFHGVVNGVPQSMLHRIVSADGERHAAWVACIWGQHGEQIVGEACWYLVDEQRAWGELAISVSDAWQGRGVADALMAAMLKGARDAGMRALYGDVLNANVRMLRFMRRHGFEPGDCDPPEDPGLVRVGCRLDPATAEPGRLA